jgi:hypothetical protein
MLTWTAIQRRATKPPSGFLGPTGRPKEIQQPRQTLSQTVGLDVIPEASHPRTDHALAGGVPHTHPRNRPTRGGFDEQASTQPGSSAFADGRASAWSGRRQTTVPSFGAASAGRPRIVAKASDVRFLARYRPRERLAPRYGAPDNSQQDCVYFRTLCGFLVESIEPTTNYQTQPPACAAR